MDLDLGFGIDYQSNEGFDIFSKFNFDLSSCKKYHKNQIWN